MQLETLDRQVSKSGVGEVYKATIRATAKVFSFFSDQTYSDKPKTILRELVANAEDARRMAGSTVPTVVTLPTEENPILSVKDQGLGMSHEFITGQFMEYANGSTKSDSNEVIGGFGIGSKSPFAYVDQFLIRSVHNGTAGAYSMFKDEDGCPAIALLDKSDTNEPNGVEVQVPIEPCDFAAFTEAAETVLGYFPDPVTLIGGEVKSPDYIARGEGWAVRPTEGELAVIMGGVRYPISHYSLPADLRANPLATYGVDLSLPIGSCSVSLSRESLSLDERTINAIIRALRDVQDNIVASFGTMFDGYPSRWAAAKALGDMAAGQRQRYRLIAQHARYKGQSLAEHYIAEGCVISVHNSRGRRRTISRFDFFSNTRVRPANIRHVIIDDLPVENRSRTLVRVKAAYGDRVSWNHDIIVVRADSVQKALEALGNPQQYVLTSSLPIPPRQTAESGGTRAHRYYACRYNSVSKAELNQLESLDGRTVLVEMDNFSPIHADFIQQWRLGLVPRDKVVFANKLAASKIKSKMISWPQAFAQARGEKLSSADADQAAYFKFVRQDSNLDPYFRYLRMIRPAIELTDAQKKRPFGQIVGLFDTYAAAQIDAGLLSLVEAKKPKGYDSKKLVSRVSKKLEWLLFHSGRVNYTTKADDMILQIIKDYI